MDFVGKVMSLLFNMLSRLVIAFLTGSKHLLISWLYSPSTVILEPKKMTSVTASIFPPSICHEVMGPDAMILVLWMLSFKPAFSLSSFTLKRSSLVLLHFLSLEWYHLHIWGFSKVIYLKHYYSVGSMTMCNNIIAKVLEHLTVDIQRQWTFHFLSSSLTISPLFLFLLCISILPSPLTLVLHSYSSVLKLPIN